MATVPTFSVPSVDGTTVSPGYQSSDFASRGVRNAGRQDASLGAGLVGVGLTGTDIATKITYEDNQRQATDLDNQLSAGLRNIAFGDGTEDNPGFFSTQGQQALDQAPAAREAVNKLVSDTVTSSSANPRVREMYNQQAAQRVNALYGQMAQHTSQERLTAQEQTYTARQVEASDNAAANYNNPTEVAKQMFIATQSAHDISTMKGEGSDATALRAQQAGSDIVKSAVLAALAQDDTTNAMGIFNANKGALVGKDLVDVQKLVTEQTLSSKAQDLAGVAAAKFPGDLVRQAGYIRSNASGKMEDAAIAEAQQNNSIIWQAQSHAFEMGQQKRTLQAQAAVDNAPSAVRTYMPEGTSAQDGLAHLDKDEQDNPTKHSAQQWDAIRNLISTFGQNADYIEATKQRNAQKTLVNDAEQRSNNIVGATSDPDTGVIPDLKATMDAAKAEHDDKLEGVTDPDAIKREQDAYALVQANIKNQYDQQNSIADRAYSDAQRVAEQQKLADAEKLKTTSKSLSTFLVQGKGNATISQWVAQNPDLAPTLLGDFSLYQNAERLENAQATGKYNAQVSDGTSLNKLRAMNPAQLATLDPAMVEPTLTKQEYDKFVSIQNGAIKQQGAIEQSSVYSKAAEMVNQYIPEADRKADPAGTNALYNEMSSFVEGYIRDNDKVPTDTEIRSRLNSIIAPLKTTGYLWGRNKLGIAGVFTAQNSPEDQAAILDSVRINKDAIQPPLMTSIQTLFADNFPKEKFSKLPDDTVEHLAALYALGLSTQDRNTRVLIGSKMDDAINEALGNITGRYPGQGRR